MDENEKFLMEAFALQEEADLKKDYIAHSGTKLSAGVAIASLDSIIDALKTVEDPEIMINIYDLGLIYDIRQQSDGDIEIDMTVTTPMCPVAGVLLQQAADAVSGVVGVGEVVVKIVWDPPWTTDRLSEDAKMMFEIF